MSDDQKLADEWAAALGAQDSGSDPTAALLKSLKRIAQLIKLRFQLKSVKS